MKGVDVLIVEYTCFTGRRLGIHCWLDIFKWGACISMHCSLSKLQMITQVRVGAKDCNFILGSQRWTLLVVLL